jgi:hypothetical protein
VPIYNVKLLSTGKSLRFRPFTVKEEKLFLMANEGEDLTTIVDTIKQILNNCILDEFQADSLPLFDIEHLFLNIRAFLYKVLSFKEPRKILTASYAYFFCFICFLFLLL